jgi:hypothetical protein
MSSFTNHGLHTFLGLKALGASTVCSAIAGLIAMVPDIHSWVETKHGYWDGIYKRYHTWHGWRRDWWKVVIFPIGFHVLIVDPLTHEKEGGWSLAGWVFEIMWWMFVIYLAWPA